MTVEPLRQQNQSINYRVYALASSLSKGAMRFYQAKFGIALPEMRLLGTLGSHRAEGPRAFREKRRPAWKGR